MKTEKDLMNMTPAELLKVIEGATSNTPDVVPHGWHTLKALADEWCLSDATTGKKINKAVELGILEKKVFSILTGAGVIRPVAHYRAKSLTPKRTPRKISE